MARPDAQYRFLKRLLLESRLLHDQTLLGQNLGLPPDFMAKLDEAYVITAQLQDMACGLMRTFPEAVAG